GGVAGRFKPGLPVPLVISVRAEQLITGTIRVQANTDATALTVEVPVEVPGGSTKQWVVSVPTSPWNDAPVAAVLVGDDGETVLGRQSVRLRYDGGAELVGVLPLLADAATLPESVALAVDAGSAFLQG